MNRLHNKGAMKWIIKEMKWIYTTQKDRCNCSDSTLHFLLDYTFQTPIGVGMENRVLRFVFEVPGIILAQFTVVSALAVRLLKSTFDSIDPRYEQVGRTLGCNKRRVFFRVILPLSRDGLIASSILTWARAVGEFGATVTLAGATELKTETLPIAIFLSLASADIEKAIAVIFILIAIAAVALITIRKVSGKAYQI